LGRQGWQHLKVRQSQVGIAPSSLVSRSISLHSPSINYRVYPFESFTPSRFEKMLGSSYPEFVHIHVFVGNHHSIKSNQEDLKHSIWFKFHLLTART